MTPRGRATAPNPGPPDADPFLQLQLFRPEWPAGRMSLEHTVLPLAEALEVAPVTVSDAQLEPNDANVITDPLIAEAVIKLEAKHHAIDALAAEAGQRPRIRSATRDKQRALGKNYRDSARHMTGEQRSANARAINQADNKLTSVQKTREQFARDARVHFAHSIELMQEKPRTLRSMRKAAYSTPKTNWANRRTQ